MLNNLFVRSGIPTYSNDTIDILRLIRSENVGPRTFSRLIDFFGSAGKALENIADFSVKGGSARPIKICTKAAAEREIEQLLKNNAYLLTYKDFNYSRLLLQIHGFPPVITYKGNIELLNSEKIVAIVGARNSSINSRSFAKQISTDLVKAGYVTVSGLARGIDTAVHESSGAQNIAVVAGGIDHIYPPENKKLYEKIIEEALLVAELPIGSKPLSQHFPQRNRIISGLSLATIIMEAGLKSGSLITAKYALEQNREVFAVPGFPLDPRCMGANKLIKEGAYLLESSEDIIANTISYQKLTQSLEESSSYNNSFKLPINSDDWEIKETDREMVIALLSSTAITYESLASETKLAMPVIYTICLELELAGKITRHAGNKISLIY